jgi:hypothetical protein
MFEMFEHSLKYQATVFQITVFVSVPFHPEGKLQGWIYYRKTNSPISHGKSLAVCTCGRTSRIFKKSTSLA